MRIDSAKNSQKRLPSGGEANMELAASGSGSPEGDLHQSYSRNSAKLAIMKHLK